MDDRRHRRVCERAEPDPSGAPYAIPRPLGARTWIDQDGVAWHRRGGVPMPQRPARRLLSRDDVLVMHVYDGEPHVHTGPDRSGLVAEVLAVWAGEDPDPHHGFDAGEFRDVGGRVMLMLAEGC